MAVLWGNFIEESLGSWQGNDLVAVLERWPSYRVAVFRGSTVFSIKICIMDLKIIEKLKNIIQLPHTLYY